jgi:serine/threonine protein kinase
MALPLYEGSRGIAPLKLPDGTNARTSFRLKLHPNGRPLICGGGTSVFTIAGMYVGPDDARLPKDVDLILRVVYTHTDGNVPSSVTLAQRNISELAAMTQVPDHPSIVKPCCWFTTPQDEELRSSDWALRIAIEIRATSRSRCRWRCSTAGWLLWSRRTSTMSVCDTRNKSRSFVHCHPDNAEQHLGALIGQLHDAIQFLQQHRITHNDLKADNIVLSRDESV